MANRNILILGASYGSLLASKVMFAAHHVALVCLPAEANLINSEGFRVFLPVKGRTAPIEIDSRKLPGKVLAGNYRCITRSGRRTAQEAVHSNLAESKSIYDFVNDLCCKLGARAAKRRPRP